MFLINTSSLKARRKEEKDSEREIKINKLLSLLCMDIWLEKKLKDRQNTYEFLRELNYNSSIVSYSFLMHSQMHCAKSTFAIIGEVDESFRRRNISPSLLIEYV